MRERHKLMVITAYAAGMAWVESAVVYYLRTMLDRLEPYQPRPLPEAGGLGPAEFVREAATLVMLLMVGILAGRNWRSRLGYAVFAFGVWDILYYVFLNVMCDWPQSLMDWDLLFLIPLPWWGPVLAPVLIASLMVIWGVLSTQFEELGVRATLPWRSHVVELRRHGPGIICLYGGLNQGGRPWCPGVARHAPRRVHVAVVSFGLGADVRARGQSCPPRMGTEIHAHVQPDR